VRALDQKSGKRLKEKENYKHWAEELRCTVCGGEKVVENYEERTTIWGGEIFWGETSGEYPGKEQVLFGPSSKGPKEVGEKKKCEEKSRAPFGKGFLTGL